MKKREKITMENILITAIFVAVFFAPMWAIDELKKYLSRKHKMNTYDYLKIYDAVLKQLEYIFRDSTLPPNMIDTMAHTRAIKEATELHRNKQLVPYYKRMKAGRV